jgi:hypothetical protein
MDESGVMTDCGKEVTLLHVLPENNSAIKTFQDTLNIVCVLYDI